MFADVHVINTSSRSDFKWSSVEQLMLKVPKHLTHYYYIVLYINCLWGTTQFSILLHHLYYLCTNLAQNSLMLLAWLIPIHILSSHSCHLFQEVFPKSSSLRVWFLPFLISPPGPRIPTIYIVLYWEHLCAYPSFAGNSEELESESVPYFSPLLAWHTSFLMAKSTQAWK